MNGSYTQSTDKLQPKMKKLHAILVIVSLAASLTLAAPEKNTIRAGAVLGGNSTVHGCMSLTQTDDEVRITGRVTGLTPGKHGFHVHEFGNVFTNGCYSTGGHFNPLNVTHGGKEDPILERHLGDLGNIVANEEGVAYINMTDRIISLIGPFSIVGRAFVVHSGEDDLGRGGNLGSLTTGNSGERLACGIVFILP